MDDTASEKNAAEITKPLKTEVDTTKDSGVAPPDKKQSWLKRTSTKKKLLIFIPIAVLLLGGILAFLLTSSKKASPVIKPAPVIQKAVVPPKPTTVASKLTGVQVTPELNARGVTGVMIENSIDARPQSGLLDAGVVYEAIAEGGITRFLALFQTEQPTYIGPVRSARPYYINWLLPYHASYMHIGGSPVALQMLSQLKLMDMGENSADNPIQRINTRYAPHNAYTSMAALDKVRADRGWGNPDFTGLARKAEAPSKTPNATTIDFAISSASFLVHYDYDAANNSYKRSEGGAPHLDEKSNKQLEPKVVVALIIPYNIDADDIHSDYASIGSGDALVFEDGMVVASKWSKPQADSPLVLQDSNGVTMPINPGQTWFTALGLASMATYKGPVAPVAP